MRADQNDAPSPATPQRGNSTPKFRQFKTAERLRCVQPGIPPASLRGTRDVRLLQRSRSESAAVALGLLPSKYRTAPCWPCVCIVSSG